MQTDRTTKALLGIIVFLSLGSLQACMASQEELSDCLDISFEACRVQAEAGDALAQASVAGLYDYGIAVPEDDAEAVRWYRLAAEQGHARAQYDLGRMYNNGLGVPEDDSRHAGFKLRLEMLLRRPV